MSHMNLQAIKKAIDCMGSQLALAQEIGVTPQFVSQLVNGTRPIPATLVRKIERATGGRVSAVELRPDIFGSPEEVAA